MSFARPLYRTSSTCSGGGGSSGNGATGPAGIGETGPTGVQGPVGNAGGLNLYFNYTDNSNPAVSGYKSLSFVSNVDPSINSVTVNGNQTDNTSNNFLGIPITNVTAIPPGPFVIYLYASSQYTCFVEAIGYITDLAGNNVAGPIFDISSNITPAIPTKLYTLNGLITSNYNVTSSNRIKIILQLTNTNVNSNTINITYQTTNAYSYLSTTFPLLGPTGFTGTTGPTGFTGPQGFSYWNATANGIYYNAGKVAVGSNTIASNDLALTITGGTNPDYMLIGPGNTAQPANTSFDVSGNSSFRGGITGATGSFTYLSTDLLSFPNYKIQINGPNGTVYQNQVAVGAGAGLINQGGRAVAIGTSAGQNYQSQYTVAIGDNAGYNTQGQNAIAVGAGAGYNTQGQNAIAVGNSAGYNTQGQYAIAIGSAAGRETQGSYAVAIGDNAGYNTQGQNAIAVGNSAGKEIQGPYTVAVGYAAGQNTQGQYAVAVGTNAGVNTQGQYAVAVGAGAGYNIQGTNAVAVGAGAGQNTQGQYAVAVGTNAGLNTQCSFSVAVGYQAGQEYQGGNAVAMGYLAGFNIQGTGSIAVGYNAGREYQGNNSVAIGNSAGQTNQGGSSVAVGWIAGYDNQRIFAVAVGSSAGQQYQGTGSIAVGYAAGCLNQGQQAIAVGCFAGQTNQPANSIVINASGTTVNGATGSAFYVNPIRTDETGNTSGGLLNYNNLTKEITYSSGITGSTGSFTYLSATDISANRLDVYDLSVNHLATIGTSTTNLASQYITTTGTITAGGLITASQGITGATGSFSYLSASQGITGPTGSFTYLSASQGITGSNLYITGTTTLSGTATAPTVAAVDNSTNIATTAFVQTLLSGVTGITGATGNSYWNHTTVNQPGIYYSTDKVAIGTNIIPSNASSLTITGGINTDFLSASQGITGPTGSFSYLTSDYLQCFSTGTCPTPSTGDNSTNIATTAFVQNTISSIPATIYNLSIPSNASVNNFIISLVASSSLTNQANILITGRISFSAWDTPNSQALISTIDFNSSVLASNSLNDISGNIIANFNTSTSGFASSFNSSAATIVYNYSTANITLTFPLTSQFVGDVINLSPACLTGFSITNYSGLTYTPTFSYS